MDISRPAGEFSGRREVGRTCRARRSMFVPRPDCHRSKSARLAHLSGWRPTEERSGTRPKELILYTRTPHDTASPAWPGRCAGWLARFQVDAPTAARQGDRRRWPRSPVAGLDGRCGQPAGAARRQMPLAPPKNCNSRVVPSPVHSSTAHRMAATSRARDLCGRRTAAIDLDDTAWRTPPARSPGS